MENDIPATAQDPWSSVSRLGGWCSSRFFFVIVLFGEVGIDCVGKKILSILQELYGDSIQLGIILERVCKCVCVQRSCMHRGEDD